MNEDLSKQILEELQRLRRNNTIAVVVCIAMLVGVIAYLPIRLRALHSATSTKSEADSWASVRKAMDSFDYDTASGIAHRLVQRYPDDYYGHAYLGNIALATGHLSEAENSYARAYEILPSSENQRMLAAIRQRIEGDAAKSTSETKPK